jgi:hypothetical protein
MSPEERARYEKYLETAAEEEKKQVAQLADAPTPPLFERVRLAAHFLAKWTGGEETVTESRMLPRVRNSLRMADMLWRVAYQEQNDKEPRQ